MGEGRLVTVTVGEGRFVTVTVTCVHLLKPIFSLLPLTGKALGEIKVRALLTVDAMLFHMAIFGCMASLVPPPLDHSGLFVSTHDLCLFHLVSSVHTHLHMHRSPTTLPLSKTLSVFSMSPPPPVHLHAAHSNLCRKITSPLLDPRMHHHHGQL